MGHEVLVINTTYRQESEETTTLQLYLRKSNDLRSSSIYILVIFRNDVAYWNATDSVSKLANALVQKVRYLTRQVWTGLSHSKLPLVDAVDFVRDPSCGAVVTFCGLPFYYVFVRFFRPSLASFGG